MSKRKRNTERRGLRELARDLTVFVEQQKDPTNASWGRLLFSVRTANDLRRKILYLRVDHPVYFDRVIVFSHRRIPVDIVLRNEWLIQPLWDIVKEYAREWQYHGREDFIYSSNMDTKWCKLSISQSQNYKKPSVDISADSIILLPPTYVPLR